MNEKEKMLAGELYDANCEELVKELNMSKVNWTPEQQDDIYEKNANILVAAAARQW